MLSNFTHTYIFIGLYTVVFSCILPNLLLFDSPLFELLVILFLDIKVIFIRNYYKQQFMNILICESWYTTHTFLGYVIRSGNTDHGVWILLTLLDPVSIFSGIKWIM